MHNVFRIVLLLGVAVCVNAAPPDPIIVDTNAVAWEAGPEKGITLKRFTGHLSRLNLVRWADGTTAAPHTHATEQILLVQSGSYRITVEGKAHVLSAGDLIIIPSFALHGIEALEASEHIAVFAPAALPQ